MTVSAGYGPGVYDADGLTRYWAIPFDYTDSDQVKIQLISSENEVTDITSNFLVDDDNDRVVYPAFSSGLPLIGLGYRIVIYRDTELTQTFDSTVNPFDRNGLNSALDNLTHMVQELKSRALLLPNDEVISEILNQSVFDSLLSLSDTLISLNASIDRIILTDNFLFSESNESVDQQLADVEYTNIITSKYRAAPINREYKAVFLGNSLTAGWGPFGEAASDSKNDYVRFVSNYLKQRFSTVTATRFNSNAWESYETSEDRLDYWTDTIKPNVPVDADLVVLQLIDNVNTEEKLTTFAADAVTLIEEIKLRAPSAIIIWAAGWYTTIAKMNLVSDACEQTNILFCDFTEYNSSSANKSALNSIVTYDSSWARTLTIDSYSDNSVDKILTINHTISGQAYVAEINYDSYIVNSPTSLTVTGNQAYITSTGAASHPNNLGFYLIAQKIIETLNLGAL